MRRNNVRGVTAAPALSVADRFAFVIEALCQAVAARHRHIETGLLVAVWKRLRRFGARFAAVAAMLRAGPVPTKRAGSEAPQRVLIAARQPAGPRMAAIRRFPTGRGWLGRLAPEALAYTEQLRRLLDDPEMAAILQAAPALGRTLRALCWSLCIDLPASFPAREAGPTQVAPSATPETATLEAATQEAATPPRATPPPRPPTPPVTSRTAPV